MSTRKYLSGYEKRKKKRKTEEFLSAMKLPCLESP